MISVFLLVCFLFGSISGNQTVKEDFKLQQNNTNELAEQIPCVYVPGLYLGSRQRELECCNETVKVFESRWAYPRAYLTRYLNTLQSWKCPQFNDECQRRTFSFNQFARNVYDHFCDSQQLVLNCYTKVKKIVENKPSYRFNAIQTVSPLIPHWKSLVEEVKLLRFNQEELQDPCLQVALYETGDKTKYQEIKSIEIPTCDFVWGGFDDDSIRAEQISAWMLVNTRCKVNIGIIFAVCVILALVITTVNVIVMCVFLTNPDLRHSQGIYKISLAVGDLLVGIILFPTFIVSLWMVARTPLTPYDSGLPAYVNVTPSTETVHEIISSDRYYLAPLINREYLKFVGFITTTSLTVSIYSLTIAGFDRLVAVRRPLRYRKDKARTLAIKLCLVVWLVALIFASLPTFVPTLNYFLVVSFFTSLAGRDSLVIYAVAFAIPVVIMWIVSTATYCYTRKHGKVRRNITKTSSASGKMRSVENRLARTLILMVGAFTLSLLPVIVVLVATFFIPYIHPSVPRKLEIDKATVVIAVEFSVFMLVACNSLWNFFIYNARNVEFRKAVRKIVHSVAKTTGLLTCTDTLGLCCRRVAYHGRRRLSSFPTLSGDRKKSSTTSEITSFGGISQIKVDSTDNSVFNSTQKYSSTELPNSKSNETGDTDVVSELGKKRKKKGREGDLARDDSIFRSFVIDANADHLFLSVMDNINEEMISPTRTQAI